MPITKIPIVHKFGIISHSQRLELQERLLKQSYLQSVESQKVIQTSRNPLEVTEEFVYQYNNAKTLDEREKYEATAHKMLERSKRRSGLRLNGLGQYVNLPMAWTELAQLAQCKGKIQEECLDVLITTLDQSPLERFHIPALFFLAETMLYWLRTDAVHQPYLRTGEIKLLKMGQLAFTRLFYHHMAGQLQGQNEFKNRLFTYLDGLSECQEAYSPYPNALLSLRFIITVGKIIMADTEVEPGEIKEGDNVSKPRTPLSRPSMPYSRGTSGTAHDRHENSERQSHSAHSGAISSSVHDLSPTLWHALDVWRCTNHLGGGLAEALQALATCGMGLSNENWVDSMIALQILAEAAKSNIAAMKILHSLARGSRPKVKGGSPPDSSRSDDSDVYSVTSDNSEKAHESRSVGSSKPSLSDIYERSEEDHDSARKSKHTRSDQEKQDNSPEKSPEQQKTALSIENLEKFESSLKKEKPQRTTASREREVSFAENAKNKITDKNRIKTYTRDSVRTNPSTRDSKRASSYQSDPLPGTAWKAEVGSDLPSGRASEASSVPTYTNLPVSDTPGINGWHWEVAITFTDTLAEICLYGSNANIQKIALMGINKDVSEPFKRGYSSVPLVSAGLLDLAFFHATNEVRDGGPNDWSWRIRFGAIQSLVKICRSLASDKAREGMRTAAWNSLLRAHSMEKDDRVLEALKVGQVHTDLEGLLNKPTLSNPGRLGGMIAGGLSNIYLPPLPPAVNPYIPPVRKSSPPPKIQQVSPRQKKPNRTTLKEEIQLATALYEPPVGVNTRLSFDLRRIVEDQWRKELQLDLEKEEKDRQKEIEINQKEEEDRQKELEVRRAQKLQKILG
ncbi:transmembrane protein 232-like isoform X2 [Mytilus californianus]|uniref:transmembrane protein 232-like isoform X2 n=1 Tax=Mytilus californianus TaxID=6549 RepID=UPI002245113D|nr:transmembrane protein 232-like isoform X2 [Mytilus californianus]